MNLYNFMNEIDETILNRGLRYFQDGHVLGTRSVIEWMGGSVGGGA